MQRLISHELIDWQKRKDRKPLLLRGVRQCGKTYILKEFGKDHYDGVAYFNFENNSALCERFEQDLSASRLITELSVLIGKKIIPEKTLIIFDEIQFCGKAITALKYFFEQAPAYHIACAGSMLGIALAKPASFPVGKVEFLTMRPMSFMEFMMAQGETMLIEHIAALDARSELPQILAEKMSDLLKTYFLTGGMPEVVARWIESQDIAVVERVQDNIISSYELDFARHAPAHDFPKLKMIWQSIPVQLASDAGKFVFGHAKPGARAKDLEDALQWLVAAGMVYKINMIDKPAIPISSYADQGHFKLFICDIGLLRRIARVPASVIIEDLKHYAEFKGAFVENFVLCELIQSLQDLPYYWRSGNTAEVDFIIQAGDRIIPIEVKSSTNVRSRSLGIYREKYRPRLAIRTSMLNCKQNDGLLNIPLYMLWKLPDFTRTYSE